MVVNYKVCKSDKEEVMMTTEDIDSNISIDYPGANNGEINKDQIIWDVGRRSEKNGKSDSSLQPVIVLIGWSGAELKNLEKYSKIFTDRGCIALRCVTPFLVLTYYHWKFPSLAKKILDTLEDKGLQSHPIFFQAFSNGGAFMYSQLLKEISVRPQFKLHGSIFDSAPFPRTAANHYRAAVTILSFLSFLKYPLAAFATQMWICGELWNHFACFLNIAWKGEKLPHPVVASTGKQFMTSDCYVMHNWLTRICKIRKHAFIFLYSEPDYIGPWEQIEDVARNLQARGNTVKLIKFPGSEHILHFKMHPEKYESAISEFVRERLVIADGEPGFWDE